MSGLEEKIAFDLKEAMKNKDVVSTSTLRMLLAAMQNLSIEKKAKLDDADILRIVSKQVKQHEDSIKCFKDGSRPDLVLKEEKELLVLKALMPKELSEEEVASIVKKAIQAAGAVSKSDFGKVMKLVMAEVGSRASGKTVTSMVQSLLP